MEKAPPAADHRAARGRPAEPARQWIEGYWEWDAGRNDFVWVTGTWRVPPPGRFWVNGYWKRDDQGWYRVPGLLERPQDRPDRLSQERPPRRPSRRRARRIAGRPTTSTSPASTIPTATASSGSRASGPRSSPAGPGSPRSGSASPKAGRSRKATGTAPSKTAAPSSPRAGRPGGPQRRHRLSAVHPDLAPELRPALRRLRPAQRQLRRLSRLLLRPHRPLYGYAQYGNLSSYYGYLDYPYYGGIGYPYMAQPVCLRRLWRLRRLRWLWWARLWRLCGYGFGYAFGGGYGGFGGSALAAFGGFGFGYPFGGFGLRPWFRRFRLRSVALAASDIAGSWLAASGIRSSAASGSRSSAALVRISRFLRGSSGSSLGNINHGHFPFLPGRNVNRAGTGPVNHMPQPRPGDGCSTTRLVSNSGHRANSVVHQGAGARGGARPGRKPSWGPSTPVVVAICESVPQRVADPPRGGRSNRQPSGARLERGLQRCPSHDGRNERREPGVVREHGLQQHSGLSGLAAQCAGTASSWLPDGGVRGGSTGGAGAGVATRHGQRARCGGGEPSCGRGCRVPAVFRRSITGWDATGGGGALLDPPRRNQRLGPSLDVAHGRRWAAVVTAASPHMRAGHGGSAAGGLWGNGGVRAPMAPHAVGGLGGSAVVSPKWRRLRRRAWPHGRRLRRWRHGPHGRRLRRRRTWRWRRWWHR